MRPTFYGLEISKSAMFIAQKQMDVTGHNLANVNTAGFTRQRIVQQAIDPYGVMTRQKDMENGKVGAGVLTHSLDQIRDTYLDRRIRSHNSTLGYWAERYDGLYEIESLLNGELGASDTSLVKLTTDFFKSVNQLTDAKASNQREVRTNLLISAQQLSSSIRDIYTQLVELQKEHDLIIDEPSAGLVAQVNNILGHIADYNKQIYAFEINNYRGDGLEAEKALDLRDQRNLLLDELSGLVDIDYWEDGNAKLHVKIAGMELLNHDDYKKLVTVDMVDNPVTPEAEQNGDLFCKVGYLPDPSKPDDIILLQFSGGQIKAHMDIRDGRKAIPDAGITGFSGIPQIVEELNSFVRTLAREFNELHESAYSFPNDENDNQSMQGFQFFAVPSSEEYPRPASMVINDGDTDKEKAEKDAAYKDYLYSKLIMGNFNVSAHIDPDQTYDGNKKGSIWNIAISDEQLEALAEGADLDKAETNNQIGLKLIALIYEDIPGTGKLFDFIASFLTKVSAETKVAKSRSDEYEGIAYELQQMFMSYSGVSQDEEMTNLIRFNHAFTAASRMITALDEQLDVIINRMGRVGL